MRRTTFLTGVLPFVAALLGATVALLLPAPSAIDAQESGLRADSVMVVDEGGTPRVRLTTPPGIRSEATALSADGDPLVSIETGAPNGLEPLNAGVYVYEPGGRGSGSLARLRMSGAGVVELGLRDRQRQDRIRLQVDAEGNPSIQLLGADGAVLWSVP